MAKRIPCFLCSRELEQKLDRHGHPYFVCQNCLMQIFVRGEQGAKNLEELVATLRHHDFVFQRHGSVLWEIQAVLSEIRGVKEEINKLEGLLDIFVVDDHKERARKLLYQRIETLLQRLEGIADGNDTLQTR
jgi:hypothetical protein